MTRKPSTAMVRQLFGIIFLSFVAQIVQIGILPPLIALRLSQAQESAPVVGIVASAPWIAILLFGHFVPRVLKRYGFIVTTIISSTFSLLAVIGISLTAKPAILFALNLLSGIGFIMRCIACDTWIVLVAAPQIRGRAIGVHEALMGCGIAAGPLVLALIGVNGMLPTIACAVLLSVSTITLMFLPNVNDWPDIPDKGMAAAIIRFIPTAIVAAFVAGFIEISSVSFLPVYAEQRFSSVAITTGSVVFGAGITVMQVPLGWLADRIGCRYTELISIIVIGLGAILLPVLAAHPFPLLVMLFFWGGATGSMYTLAVADAGQRVNNKQVSTAMMGIAMSYTTGGALGAVVTGFATNWLTIGGLSFTGIVAAIGFILVWSFNARQSPQGTSGSQEASLNSVDT